MSNFWLSLKNSVIVTVPTVAVATVICAMAAYIIARKNNKFYNAVYYIFLMALLIPFQMLMLPLYMNLRNFGLINTLTGFILAKIGSQITWNILVMTGFVKTVPRELEESALIDGANKYISFWRIVFPLMKPIIFTTVIVNALHTWNDFSMAVILLQKTSVRTLPLTQYFFFGENFIQLNLAFAVFTLSMIPILVLYLVLQKYIISGVMVGAVKG